MERNTNKATEQRTFRPRTAKPPERFEITIYIGNMSYTRDEIGIKYLFSKYGKVVSLELITDPGTERSKGYAFVRMMSAKDGRRAIKMLDGKLIDGRTLKVSQALEQDQQPHKTFTPKKIVEPINRAPAIQNYKQKRAKEKRGLHALFENTKSK